MSANVEVKGLSPLVRELKGSMFRDVNKELRQHAKQIAQGLVPVVSEAVARSAAPQGDAMSRTVRAHSDRVPVVVVGKTNPKLSGFSRRGPRRDGSARQSPKLRRGSLAHGVVYGPAGGKRETPPLENYYKISRDQSGGPLGRALQENGAAFEKACDEYLKAFSDVMTRHGFIGQSVKAKQWNGRG